jgi:hypothetical protein
VDHTRGRVYWYDAGEDPMKAMALLHEMAHAIDPTPPIYVCELDIMLALEHEASRRLRLPWAEWMRDYGTQLDESWGETNTRARGEFLAEAYANAEREGLMRERKPTYVRKCGR